MGLYPVVTNAKLTKLDVKLKYFSFKMYISKLESHFEV